jgi:hypothetical protein
VQVRIAAAVPTSGGFRYDLRYIAYGPGRHNLGKYLVHAGNVPPDPRPEIVVEVDSILPKNFNGELFPTETLGIDLHSSYRVVMGSAWCLWGLLLIPLLLLGYKRQRLEEPAPPPLTTSERLRALLEQAAHVGLPVEQQVELERLLVAFWSGRLNLSTERLVEALAQLRRHPVAGREIAQVEAWLHARHPPADGAVARELLRELAADLGMPTRQTMGAAR